MAKVVNGVDSLSPVSELHHEIQRGNEHEEMEERVAVVHLSLLIVDVTHPPFSLLVLPLLPFLLCGLLFIWKTITQVP